MPPCSAALLALRFLLLLAAPVDLFSRPPPCLPPQVPVHSCATTGCASRPKPLLPRPRPTARHSVPQERLCSAGAFVPPLCTLHSALCISASLHLCICIPLGLAPTLHLTSILHPPFHCIFRLGRPTARNVSSLTGRIEPPVQDPTGNHNKHQHCGICKHFESRITRLQGKTKTANRAQRRLDSLCRRMPCSGWSVAGCRDRALLR